MSTPPSDQPSFRLMDTKLEAERMHDVTVLLSDLFEREEPTVKKILDCLYDVGADSLIDQRVPCRPVKKMARSVATLSRPAFKVIAWRWFRRNCPDLITRWLQRKIKSQTRKKTKTLPPKAASVAIAAPVTPAPLSQDPPSLALKPSVDSIPETKIGTRVIGTKDLEALPPEIMEVALLSITAAENRHHEVQQLQGRVQTLTRTLAGTVVVLGGAVIWMGYSLFVDPVQVKQSEGAITAKDELPRLQPQAPQPQTPRRPGLGLP